MSWNVSNQRTILGTLGPVFLFIGLLQSNKALADKIVNYEHGRVVSVEPITKKSYRWVPRFTCDNEVTVFYRQGDRNGVRQRAIHSEHLSQSNGTGSSCRSYRDKEYIEKEVGYNVTFEYLGTLRTVRFEQPPRSGFILLKTEMKIYAIE